MRRHEFNGSMLSPAGVKFCWFPVAVQYNIISIIDSFRFHQKYALQAENGLLSYQIEKQFLWNLQNPRHVESNCRCLSWLWWQVSGTSPNPMSLSDANNLIALIREKLSALRGTVNASGVFLPPRWISTTPIVLAIGGPNAIFCTFDAAIQC